METSKIFKRKSSCFINFVIKTTFFFISVIKLYGKNNLKIKFNVIYAKCHLKQRHFYPTRTSSA